MLVEDYQILFKDTLFKNLRVSDKDLEPLWEKVSFLIEELTGPLYSISTEGNWDYVYSRKDEYFKKVHCMSDMKSWFEYRLEMINDALEECSKFSQLEAYQRIKDNSKNVKRCVDMALLIQEQYEVNNDNSNS